MGIFTKQGFFTDLIYISLKVKSKKCSNKGIICQLLCEDKNKKRYNFSPVDGRDDDKDDIVGQQLLPDELPQRRSPPAAEAMHRGENHID